jgi:hypothetical protein
MTKDDIREKVSRDLHRLYDHHLQEGIKPAEQTLLDKLK